MSAQGRQDSHREVAHAAHAAAQALYAARAPRALPAGVAAGAVS
ncbi:hypothetical protein LMG28688_01055 [Paraburkholderia caffeinitolerans]|uniref:Uncharacterized protein n=1 Tax=Paraburkholderia caffeinitolerans TaxID=1723730 RepID=A0A6J5FM51_9BURK|nr:hypothetical protein [Paraburkholderia caffeinitolerans]CAB3780520.1 hypothetical protein LMG28688_01055 [Paraburkholderia caffeinitolerans]